MNDWTLAKEIDGHSKKPWWVVYDEEGEFLFDSRREHVSRLIAAAPDLLAALKIAQAWMPLPGHGYTAEANREAEMVAAAIDRAEGRTPPLTQPTTPEAAK